MTDRQVLPNRRDGYTLDLRHGNQNTVFAVTIGFFPGTEIPAEVFISGAKAGSEIEAIARDSAVLLSLALQHGVAIDVVKHAITREADGRPQTILGRVVDLLAAPPPPENYD